MKLLYSGLKYNYGKKEESYSYEWNNLEAGIRDCVEKDLFEAAYWHPDEDSVDQIVDLILDWKPDIIFHVAFNDSLDIPEAATSVAFNRDIPCVQFDCDSSWRFQDFILPRKRRFSHFITTHNSTIPWYQANGMKVIKSQWGCSPLYKKLDLPKKYDASFIGQKHGVRPHIISGLRNTDLKIDLWGSYWEDYPEWHGYATFEEMLNIFNESKICMNFSNPWHIGTLEQIKGRAFEIPACGAFQLTTPADDLGFYFIPDKEIVIAGCMADLIEKTDYYLSHDKEREDIANAGYERVQREHLWSHRFTAIFKEIGLL